MQPNHSLSGVCRPEGPVLRNSLKRVEESCSLAPLRAGRADRRISRSLRRRVLPGLRRGARHRLFAGRQGGELQRSRPGRHVRRASGHRRPSRSASVEPRTSCLVASMKSAAFLELMQASRWCSKGAAQTARGDDQAALDARLRVQRRHHGRHRAQALRRDAGYPRQGRLSR